MSLFIPVGENTKVDIYESAGLHTWTKLNGAKAVTIIY